QAPSDYPEIAEYLVRLGIDSISLLPDTVLSTTLAIVELEKKLGFAEADRGSGSSLRDDEGAIDPNQSASGRLLVR
ncbi:MAG TPA: hypothetical protein VLE23_06035, partial [Geminicoccaceae bacterium]|nr:hypothetical protein [Geminicoccaceae bacterium]